MARLSPGSASPSRLALLHHVGSHSESARGRKTPRACSECLLIRRPFKRAWSLNGVFALGLRNELQLAKPATDAVCSQLFVARKLAM